MAGRVAEPEALLRPAAHVPQMQLAGVVPDHSGMQHHLIVELAFYAGPEYGLALVPPRPVDAVFACCVADRVAAVFVAHREPHVEAAVEPHDCRMVDFRGVGRSGWTVAEDRLSAICLGPAKAVGARGEADLPGKAVSRSAVVPHPPFVADFEHAGILGVGLVE